MPLGQLATHIFAINLFHVLISMCPLLWTDAVICLRELLFVEYLRRSWGTDILSIRGGVLMFLGITPQVHGAAICSMMQTAMQWAVRSLTNSWWKMTSVGLRYMPCGLQDGPWPTEQLCLHNLHHDTEKSQLHDGLDQACPKADQQVKCHEVLCGTLKRKTNYKRCRNLHTYFILTLILNF